MQRSYRHTAQCVAQILNSNFSISVSHNIKTLSGIISFPITYKTTVAKAINAGKVNHTSLDTTKKFDVSRGNLWELNAKHWKLDTVAADYYLLILGSIIDPNKFKRLLEPMSVRVCDQFARYTDMALGGELRHATTVKGLPRRLAEALRDRTIRDDSRHMAWQGWYHFRQRYGKLALEWAVEAFSTKRWNKAYGGGKWATIANTLLMLENDDIKPQGFIDTCWGLQHNGGIYFNKWWPVKGIQQVLDLNQKGWYCSIVPTASGFIREKTKEIAQEACECPSHE